MKLPDKNADDNQDEYKVGSKFTAKKFPAVCISLFVFVHIIKYLSEVDFELTACCAMFPLILILAAVFLNSVLPRDPLVTKVSQIVEAQVTDVKSYRTRFGLCHIATLYVPVLNKKIEAGLNAAAGRHVIIVRQNNTLTFVKMHIFKYCKKDVIRESTYLRPFSFFEKHKF